MTRHLLRLVWNRKRQNLLLALEILLTFLVTFGVMFFAVSYYDNWARPLGFDIERVWTIRVGYPNPRNPSDSPEMTVEKLRAASQRIQRLLAAIADLPNVEKLAGTWGSVPYRMGGWGTGIEAADGRRLQTAAASATDDYASVFRMTMLAGRWFSREDDGATWQPIVVNAGLAREIFGDRDPVNQVIPTSRRNLGTVDTMPRRVVGVIDDFRHEGEFALPGNFMFVRASLDGAVQGPPLANVFVVRVAPGTTAAYEETVIRTLQAVAPDWSFELLPNAEMREDALAQYATPLIITAIIAGFLILMVALGLTGVVWQSVTLRIQEFGLRRAKGAAARDIQRQVLTELVLMTTLALAVGVALVAQIPALPLLPTTGPTPPASVWFTSIAASVAVIYLFTLLCAWYPSRLATKIQPAEALHYE
jgi:putative ABC transport system permease protein